MILEIASIYRCCRVSKAHKQKHGLSYGVVSALL
jgi:hypothetical protein